jgi:hypothetical protein
VSTQDRQVNLWQKNKPGNEHKLLVVNSGDKVAIAFSSIFLLTATDQLFLQESSFLTISATKKGHLCHYCERQKKNTT